MREFTFHKYRIQVLSNQLIRIEFDENKRFDNRLSQQISNRKLDDEIVVSSAYQGEIKLETPNIQIYIINPLIWNDKNVYVKLFESDNQYDILNLPPSLGGTARTLDGIDGKIELSSSIVSRSGLAVLDDSKSLRIENDKPTTFSNSFVDLYLFGFGYDYIKAVKTLYKITGNPLLPPKQIFGNWWSKYYAYHDYELVALVDKFRDLHLPFSILMVDMDWHITEIKGLQSYHEGWTGFTVNPSYFPNLEKFLSELKSRGYLVGFNLHPADGIKFYEKSYHEMCNFLELDPTTKEAIPFDVTNQPFLDGYLNIVLKPLNEAGVDFWWIDWQQGTTSNQPGLDPLWVLNRIHYYYDINKNKRPIVLSRYDGVGSHRFIVGFSGDTVVSWESLDFQPYFTSTSQNIGFSMWSHDIGGHFRGNENEELFLRWTQLGVFSPVFRYHSSNYSNVHREPFNKSYEIFTLSKEILNYRYLLVTYIYSEALKHSQGNLGFSIPMYYFYPKDINLYDKKYQNQYFFGSELVVAPITKPLKVESTKEIYLPGEGMWTNIFTNEQYQAGKHLIEIKLDSVLVFARPGAILVKDVSNSSNHISSFPTELTISVYATKNNQYVLFEDDGVSLGASIYRTTFNLIIDKDIFFEVIHDDNKDINFKRNYTFEFIINNRKIIKKVTKLSNEKIEIVIPI